jgi:hypothetical protein
MPIVCYCVFQRNSYAPPIPSGLSQPMWFKLDHYVEKLSCLGYEKEPRSCAAYKYKYSDGGNCGSKSDFAAHYKAISEMVDSTCVQPSTMHLKQPIQGWADVSN